MKITPREKRRHAAGREKNEGLQTKPKLLNQARAEQITRVALVEATKQKANPATDEVRVESRNHGLA